MERTIDDEGWDDWDRFYDHVLHTGPGFLPSPLSVIGMYMPNINWDEEAQLMSLDAQVDESLDQAE